MVQLYLDRTVPNLEEKLFAFLNDHQLRQYAGSRNMLAQWAQTKLRNIIRQPFAQYVLDKQMVEVMREKQKINELLLKTMNDRFSKYGVVFTAVAISSPIDPVSSQSREGLAKVVHAEYQQKLLTRQKEGLTPLTLKVVNKKQEGITAVEKAMSTARGEAATIVANAQQKRATDVTATIGKENYAKLEALVRLSDGLKEGNVPVNIVPSSLTAIFGGGQAAAVLPSSKK